MAVFEVEWKETYLAGAGVACSVCACPINVHARCFRPYYRDSGDCVDYNCYACSPECCGRVTTHDDSGSLGDLLRSLFGG
jgi:hypothetical protein